MAKTPWRPDPEARAEYVGRVNRVVDHIERNLGRPLPVAELARIAHFSPFHFQRVFHGLMGETLARFVQRLRVERAASMLLAHPKRSVTTIALDCGFGSAAAFARAFKGAFGMTATAWRRSRDAKDRTLGQSDRTLREAADLDSFYFDPDRGVPRWDVARAVEGGFVKLSIEIREVPALTVAYVRHVGPFAGDSALFMSLYAQLRRWAVPRGLFTEETRFLAMGHDDPSVADDDKKRLSICIPVPPATRGEGEIGIMTRPGGTCAVADAEVATQDIPRAWHTVISEWVPSSGYQLDERPCYSRVLASPRTHPEGKHQLELLVPVRPL